MFFNGLRMEMEDQFRVNASFSRDVWHLSVADLRRFRVLANLKWRVCNRGPALWRTAPHIPRRRPE